MKTMSKISSTLSRIAMGGMVTSFVITTPFMPANAELRRYQFTSGDESIRIKTEAFDALADIGITLLAVENLVTPAPGFDYGWILLPPPTSPGERGTTFEFLYDEDTNIFIPLPTSETGGTFEYNGSIFLGIDQTKFNLPSVLQLGEISATVTDELDSLVFDTVTTNLPIWDIFLELPDALTADLENRTLSFDPIDLTFTTEFSEYLVAAALTQETADQVANLVPGLSIAVLRGDRTISQIPEPSSTLALMILGGGGVVSHLRKKTRNTR